MAWTGVALTDLNNFLRNKVSFRIRPEAIPTKTPLFGPLRDRLDKDRAAGDNYEILIQSARPYTGTVAGEDIDLVLPRTTAYVKMEIPMMQMQATAGVTMQALDFATGGQASWERVITAAIRDREADWNNLLEIIAIGDGTGRLARVSTVGNANSVTTVTCDSTYLDFGWENVQRIRKDMLIEIYSASGTLRALTNAAGTVLNYGKVTGVTFGSRNNGAATTGTFTYASDGTTSIANGDIVYIYGAHSSAVDKDEYADDGADQDMNYCLPIGLTGLIQPAVGGDYLVDGAVDYKLATFQKVTRASYSTQLSPQYDAADWATAGTAGTPDTWGLSVITDYISDGRRNSGKYVDCLICSDQLASCMHRLNRAEGSINVVVNTTKGQDQPVIGSMVSRSFIRPDGVAIPIHVTDTVPRNVLYGLCTEDFIWLTAGDFDNLAPRLGGGRGDMWMKSPGDRKTNFEAPFGGYANVAAEACNSSFVILDLKDNLG